MTREPRDVRGDVTRAVLLSVVMGIFAAVVVTLQLLLVGVGGLAPEEENGRPTQTAEITLIA